MTTNSQVSTQPKNKQQKKQTKQTTRTGTESRNGDHMEDYQQVGGGEKRGEKVQGIRRIIGRYNIGGVKKYRK